MRSLHSANCFSVFIVERNFEVANLLFSTKGVGFQNLALFARRVSKAEGFNPSAEGGYQEKSWFLQSWCTDFHNKYLELAHCPPG